jgi:hypothetical protein
MITSGVESKQEPNKVKHETWQEFASALCLCNNYYPLLVLFSPDYNLQLATSCNMAFGYHSLN